MQNDLAVIWKFSIKKTHPSSKHACLIPKKCWESVAPCTSSTPSRKLPVHFCSHHRHTESFRYFLWASAAGCGHPAAPVSTRSGERIHLPTLARVDVKGGDMLVPRCSQEGKERKTRERCATKELVQWKCVFIFLLHCLSSRTMPYCKSNHRFRGCPFLVNHHCWEKTTGLHTAHEWSIVIFEYRNSSLIVSTNQRCWLLLGKGGLCRIVQQVHF